LSEALLPSPPSLFLNGNLIVTVYSVLKFPAKMFQHFLKSPLPRPPHFPPTNPTFAPGYVYLSWLRIRGCPAGTFCKVASRRMIDKDNFIPDLITGDNADMIMMTHRQGGGCMKFRGFSTFSA
jgi:hypothetical protein